MKQYISKPIMVEAAPAQELLDLVKNNQELPEVINELFIDGVLSFGNDVIYVEGVEAHGNTWIVVELDTDPVVVKILEDEKFQSMFEGDDTVPAAPSKPAEPVEPPRSSFKPATDSPTVPAPVPTPPVDGGNTGPENGGRTNYQAPQQGGSDQGRHERPRSEGQNLDGLKS